MKVFGAIGFFDGDLHYMETPEKFNGGTYIEFLKVVLGRYSQPVFLIEDGAKYHFSPPVKKVKDRMRSEKRVYTYKLPSYSLD